MAQPEDTCRLPNSGALENQASRGKVHQVLAICGVLIVAVGLVFGQTVQFDFINLDDSADVYLNSRVTEGLTAETVNWAFTERCSGAWMPLVWLSHMLDVELFGLNAGGHHLTNVLLHAATAVFLFLVLRQMTGRLWPSALVAVVFAIHPLRVESVAWVTERKDVLSGLFFVLALGAYLAYVRHRFSLVRYLAVMVFFVLGLMAKPMLVTLPCVLLLLDFWPLGRCTDGAGRWRLATVARLVLEKVPLFAVTIVSCYLTVWAYGSEGVDLLEQRYSLLWRLGNAPISYVSYLGMFFYPANLAIPYPRPGLELPLWKVVGAIVVLVALTAAALVSARKHPYMLVGWLWYVGMLAPVSGILQFGMQLMADRFTYLPQIGLCIALAWGLADALKAWPRWRPACAVAVALLLVGVMACAWRQTSFWRDNFTLWRHTLTCTPRNRLAQHALANAHLDRGEVEKAIDRYRAAIEAEPDYALSHYNLGVALASLGRLDEAIQEYQTTVELEPKHAVAHNNLGNALLTRGQLDRSQLTREHLEKALFHCHEAARLDPKFAEAHFNAGNLLFFLGRVGEAVAAYQQAIALKPEFADAHYCLGLAFAQRGQVDEAIAKYREALELKSDFAAEIHNVLGLALVARGRPDEAVKHYQKALALRPGFVQAQENLNRVLLGIPTSR